jgi:hypothetical protein
MKLNFLLLSVLFVSKSVFPQSEIQKVEQFAPFEIQLKSTLSYSNPYTDVEVWAEFSNEIDTFLRPGFWDGENTWKIRFAPTDSLNIWRYTTYSSNPNDLGLHNQTGSFQSVPTKSSNELLRNGTLKMSAGKRSVVQRTGKPFLMVGNTGWASPFRATLEQVEIYAENCENKGFNTVLLSVVQPDRKAQGPNERNTDQGFKRAFADLEDGHLNQIEISYFKYFDDIVDMYREHEIVPVFAPLLHGYGWKGLSVMGNQVVAHEYLRYCKYLLARYGCQPAMWLLTVDGAGNSPGVADSGEMLEKWDCYRQPTGLHYNPCDDFIATWAVDLENPLEYCMHGNKTHQDKVWLDFQWAQTGHGGLHLYHKVEKMYDNLPTKAVANGEPTYEGMEDGKYGLGWWQGEEAWMQLMHGGTMGVVYGAAALWQWKITPDEKGWESWTDQPLSWKGAMQMEGSNYVGLVSKILKNHDLTDIEKRWDLANGKPLLAVEGELYISYLNNGGAIEIKNIPAECSNYKWVNPKTGEIKVEGKTINAKWTAPDTNPWVLIIYR